MPTTLPIRRALAACVSAGLLTCARSTGSGFSLSVFECRVSPDRFAHLIGEIQDAINPKRDSVVIYRFAGEIQEARTTLGRKRSHELGEPWVL